MRGSSESCGNSRYATEKSKLCSLVGKGTFEFSDTTLLSIGHIEASVNSRHKRRNEGVVWVNWSQECSAGVGGR